VAVVTSAAKAATTANAAVVASAVKVATKAETEMAQQVAVSATSQENARKTVLNAAEDFSLVFHKVPGGSGTGLV
jgi:hypothetical protein